MAPGGAAERDGRLRLSTPPPSACALMAPPLCGCGLAVGDEWLKINGNSTEGMGHADAFTIIKHKGDIVKLTVRRFPESLSGRKCVSVYMCACESVCGEWIHVGMCVLTCTLF